MQEILFPVLTGLSLIFAGILVGYFIWFRDRTERVALCEDLTAENERLGAELEESSSITEDLKKQLENRRDRSGHLQQLCDDLLVSREKSLKHSSELERELYEARCKLEQAREQLTAESRLLAKSEEQLHQTRQQYLESATGLDKEWREKLAESQSLAAHRENEITRLLNSNEQKAQLLHQANAEVAELGSELSAQHRMLEIAKKNAAGLEKEYVSLESTMRAQIKLLNESRGQAAAELSARKLAEESVAESRRQIEELQVELKQMEQLSTSVETLRAETRTLEATIENERSRSRSVARERDGAMADVDDTRKALEGLRKRSENQEVTIRQLRAHQEAFNEIKFSRLEDEKEQLRQECTILTRRIADTEKIKIRKEEQLNQALDDNQRLSAELEDLERKFMVSTEQASGRLDSLLRQRDEALRQNNELKEVLARMKSHARANETTIRNLRRERGAVLMRNRQTQDSYPRIHNAGTSKVSDADILASEYGGTTKTDPIRGIVFVAPPRIRDDLKRIHGVAAVLEQKLNEFGIYTFKQIMAWDDRAVQKFSELMVFKDRIERDDWMGQAATLYHQDRRRRVA